MFDTFGICQKGRAVSKSDQPAASRLV